MHAGTTRAGLIHIRSYYVKHWQTVVCTLNLANGLFWYRSQTKNLTFKKCWRKDKELKDRLHVASNPKIFTVYPLEGKLDNP
jgi:hypothetical protein